MPAPDATFRHIDSKPALGHVNLMVDTFIANATADDLRSIVRNLLATGPPGITPAFANAARLRLRQTSTRPLPDSYSLFHAETRDSPASPLPHLHEVLTRARSMYGAGLGFSSLAILASIVRATIGLRWEDDGDMADILAVIDADIGQAIQSSKEEIQGSRVLDFASAREARETLRCAVRDSMDDVKTWGGEFPFERASASLEHWKI
ncbi:hypothetical protein JR316_0010388 [Psilocybe cubensis]|uniref:Uncharacterized protein n=2 Tax=Psilocybe cubensis TaxID=181762 RepID=A0ACB8GLR0_PSICU|nr:hypothetical protein JR316_0010388 [Psilocybe cubensis]KAH9476476.1 hypothetical protein JR316_0010388 [Psilocybe cubensis]